jgi:hypothetical protein
MTIGSEEIHDVNTPKVIEMSLKYIFISIPHSMHLIGKGEMEIKKYTENKGKSSDDPGLLYPQRPHRLSILSPSTFLEPERQELHFSCLAVVPESTINFARGCIRTVSAGHRASPFR